MSAQAAEVLRTDRTQNQPLVSTGQTLKFPLKITHFAENRISIFPLHRETLVSEIPARLSPYTVLLNYFLQT